ncbi:MAG: hypothetical protein ACRCYY_17920 [Trueperaceae bacterium]
MKHILFLTVLFLCAAVSLPSRGVAQTPDMCSALDATPDDIPVSTYRGCEWSKEGVEARESSAKAGQIPEISYAEFEVAVQATVDGYLAQPDPPNIEWTELESVAPCASGKMVVITPTQDGQVMEAFSVALVFVDCRTYVLNIETQGEYVARALEIAKKTASIPLEP